MLSTEYTELTQFAPDAKHGSGSAPFTSVGSERKTPPLHLRPHRVIQRLTNLRAGVFAVGEPHPEHVRVEYHGPLPNHGVRQRYLILSRK